MDCFSNTARRFGLTVNLNKSKVLYQPKPGSSFTPPVVIVYGTPLTSVDKFSYLGSTLSQNIVVDDDISVRLSRAGAAFGNLTRRLWNEHGITTATKVNSLQSSCDHHFALWL